MDIIIICLIVCLLGIVAILIFKLKNMEASVAKRVSEENLKYSNQLATYIQGQNQLIIDVLNNNINQMAVQVNNSTLQNDKKLEDIRLTMERRLKSLQEDNNTQLEKMRGTVDEKLQKTLDDKIGQSFKLVNERLEQVYKGLGEMQALASGVGDLKKVLTNVKSRGILGEIQLRGILEEILPKEQYEENVKVSPESKGFVEFAIKLPGDSDGKSVYLPIDAKFPGDAYAYLRDAIDSGSKEEVAIAKKNLENAIKKAAKDISEKYIEPPFTTDFAIMFLPFEGLYAEVINMGLVETLQRDYKINIAGPTTMAALLNSLQMGFKTLAIQKRSSEVWNVLGAVKNEFSKFEETLEATQKKITQANESLEKLVGTRTRMINSKLKKISMLNDENTQVFLEGNED